VTDTDRWPIRDADTGVLFRDRDTLVGAGPPPHTPPPPPPPSPSPDGRFGSGMLLAIAAIALAAAGVAIAYFLTHESKAQPATTTVVRSTAPQPAATKKVAVPRVVGLKEQPALLRLAQLGLRPKEVYKPTKQPKGVVVSQKPKEATEVKKGSQVRIVIDSGAPRVAVPDLGGKTFADAQAALDKLGLDSTRTQVTSGAPAGTVVDQAPKAGAKLAKGSTVTLAVSQAKAASAPAPGKGATTAPTTTASARPTRPQNATVPDVTQQSEAAAAQALSGAGILPSLVFIPSNDPLGTVEQQAKGAGTTVPYHSHVQINVSRGPGEKPDVAIPNVIGQSLHQAVATLNAAKLRLLYVRYPVFARSKAGKIVQQTPLGGGKAPQNAQVLVFLASYEG
jgi:serine/threonine-protein kinase